MKKCWTLLLLCSFTTWAQKLTPSQEPVFSERSVLIEETIFGSVAGGVGGLLGFYITKGFADLFGKKYNPGTTYWNGFNYELNTPGFYGGVAGITLGSTIGVYVTGQSEEENGSFWATLGGAGAGLALALPLAEIIGTGADRSFWAYIPVVT